MDPGLVATRLASSIAGPLIRKLFVHEGPGAALTDRPVRISGLVSFRGEKRVLTEKDLHALATELLRRAIGPSAQGERPGPFAEEEAVALALARTLHCLGDIDMDDVQAVQLGPQALARSLKAADASAARSLSADAAALYEAVLETACLHILHFFTQRSSFVARTLVQHSSRLAEAIAKADQLLERTPSLPTQDGLFEARYAQHIAHKYGMLTIYGIDLSNSPDQWPLNTAYLSLEAAVARDALQAPIRAERAFAGRDRVLLRGVAGSGKTTLVQWLAVAAASQDPKALHVEGQALAPLFGRIPFVLQIRTLTRQDDDLPTPEEFLSRTRNPLAGAQPQGWADRVLAAGRGLVLIDGIDEAPAKVRERTRRWLRDLLVSYPGNLWLVTSRPSAVRDRWLAAEKFAELSLAPMSRQDVTSFVRRWHAAARSVAPPEDQDQLAVYETSLITAIRTKHDLARLSTNPLMCGLICALHCDRRGFLPHARKELYEAALSMLLSRRDRERDMASPDGIELSEEPKTRLLQRLAYKFILNGKAELDRSHAERIIADVLPGVPVAATQGDAEAIFQHLLLRSGLLREPALGSIDFVHRTFQDYLGAKAAIEEGDTALLVLRAIDTQWEDVVRMAVAHARPNECADLLLDLVRRGDAATTATRRTHLHLLATAALEHVTELEPRVRAEVEHRAAALIPPRSLAEAEELAAIGAVVLELLPGPDNLSDEAARLVVQTAALIGGDAAIPFLSLYQRHPDSHVRQVLATSWHRFDTLPYAEEVLSGLTEDDVYFEIATGDELAALNTVDSCQRLLIRSGFDTNALIQNVNPRRLTDLCVPADQSVTWYWLAAFPHLHTLTLEPRPDSVDVSSLAAHPGLRTLRIAADQLISGQSSLEGRMEIVRLM